ncbi:winged helix-turn-helix domain-containing protein [Halostella sp. JP-L12]|uniref:winged helix-turn-helix transcriptional regulator n=1 Tax=Halostella TaxID=1843185 RepID=UPI000EF79D41|nr:MULTISPECIES: winged helix-turn-helix transcriptional regulator [Halostella]NHN49983.1 winged helix-turn-helix domain-containing protein [Halostella sp. JP-L12]
MAVHQPAVTLEPDQLNKTDRRLLELLREGRVTPQYVAGELDISRPYASERLTRFMEHEAVEKIAPGLYELVDDPEEDDAE